MGQYQDSYNTPKLFHHITMFVLPYLEYQLIQRNSNLVLDVISDIYKHFRAILPIPFNFKINFVKQQENATCDDIFTIQRHQRKVGLCTG